MSLPLILRAEAESDARQEFQYLEKLRRGLGSKFLARLRESFERIEANPELCGFVWQDVRASRLKQFRYIVYYINSPEYTEVIAVLHSSRDETGWQSRV